MSREATFRTEAPVGPCHSRSIIAATARLALHRVRDAVAPLSLDELTRITEIWVDTAMQLSDKSLRVMERLVRAQLRRPDPSSEASAALGSARSE